jgi:hypothetical protein
MSEYNSGLPPQLPAELERALQHATSRTLGSLAKLRKSLRLHVHSERNQGVSFAEIETNLRLLITRVEAEAHDAAGEPRDRDSLSDRVVKWSEVFFDQAEP